MSMAKALSPGRIRLLHEAFGSFLAMLSASPAEFGDVLQCQQGTASRIQRMARQSQPGRCFKEARRIGAQVLEFGNSAYPCLLANIPDPPTVLWARGALDLLLHPMLAVVGARRCTDEGVLQATRLVAGCVEEGWRIVSGGARGIDAAAHREAIRRGSPTVAVLGSGLGRPYPPEHAPLFDEVVDQGGLILSEYPCDREPRPGQFPARNRIVAGLSVGVVMVEAGWRSGALITGRLAGEDYGREVMAVPGAVTPGRSSGCHRAIREGWAALVDAPEQVLEQLRDAQGLCLSMAGTLKNRIIVKENDEVADEGGVACRAAPEERQPGTPPRPVGRA
ncbi:MAG: DNA-processing protein DprA [Phycisphaerales bacterium]|nr:DNA-processing protein DprA [Phycisphaerales bacterium]